MIPRGLISRTAPKALAGRALAIATIALALSPIPAVGGVSADLRARDRPPAIAPAVRLPSADDAGGSGRAGLREPGISWWAIARGLTVLLTIGLVGGVAPACTPRSPG